VQYWCTPVSARSGMAGAHQLVVKVLLCPLSTDRVTNDPLGHRVCFRAKCTGPAMSVVRGLESDQRVDRADDLEEDGIRLLFAGWPSHRPWFVRGFPNIWSARRMLPSLMVRISSLLLVILTTLAP
jgi:hypothetical protein